MAAIDPRSTRAWRKLKDQVVEEEPDCRLQLPGCTFVSTTADHILTVRDRPDLALVRSNLRGSCESCNRRRLAKPDTELPIGAVPRSRALDIFKPLSSLPKN